LPLPKWRASAWLLRKEARELLASRSYWLLLLVIGLLVGHAFLTAAETYAEFSGAGGGSTALSHGLSPLDGIVVPIFGAYDIAATFLLPFVVIRLVASEKQNGALKLLLQSPAETGWMLCIKAVALFAAWTVAMVPGAVALVMWSAHGGHLNPGEVAVVVMGHFVMAGITIAVAAVAGAIAASSASAAIVALTFTLTTWAIAFIAEARGGWIKEISEYTPLAIVRTFEFGELRLATVIVVAVFIVAGLTVAGISLDIGDRLRSRAAEIVVVVICAGAAAMVASTLHASWDLSENRWNSFPRADEAMLRSIDKPLAVKVFLAAEDSRLQELENEVLRKLERTMKHVTITNGATSRTGLVDTSSNYGETWYTMGDSTVKERSVAAPIVLLDIYSVAGVTPPPDSNDAPYPGYPMPTKPPGIVLVFFIIWPLLLLAAWLGLRRSLVGNAARGPSPGVAP
jgi:ABC-2 type transport system permease protein